MMYVITNDTLPDRWDVQEVPNTYDLDKLQALVGGNIEFVPMPARCPVDVIVNEEGMLLGMPVNGLATTLVKSFWLQAHDPKDLVMSMLTIVGPCIIRVRSTND